MAEYSCKHPDNIEGCRITGYSALMLFYRNDFYNEI